METRYEIYGSDGIYRVHRNGMPVAEFRAASEFGDNDQDALRAARAWVQVQKSVLE